MAPKGPAAADLQATLARQAELFLTRLGGFGPADWALQSANPGWSNADTAFHAGESLRACARGVERRADPARPRFPRGDRPADARLPGELAVAAERLTELLAATDATELVWHPVYRLTARSLAAVALAEVVLHRWDLTGPGDRGPEPRAARLVLQGLFASRDDSGASPTALLLHLSGRQRLSGRPGWPGAIWEPEPIDEVVAERARRGSRRPT